MCVCWGELVQSTSQKDEHLEGRDKHRVWGVIREVK